MHTLNDFINSDWLDEGVLSEKYVNAKPFPHIVMKNFIKYYYIFNSFILYYYYLYLIFF